MLHDFKLLKKVLQFFFRLVWKKEKKYFILNFFNAMVESIIPLLPVFFLPYIIDELLTGTKQKEVIVYIFIIVFGETLLRLINSLLKTNVKNKSEILNNYLVEEMNRHIMKMEFHLTENKDVLDQVSKAKDGIGWYSGGVDGLFGEFFNIAKSLLITFELSIFILIKAPYIFVLTSIMLIINSKMNRKKNKVEVESYHNISKLNRTMGYLGWTTTELRFAKDVRLYNASDLVTGKWNEFATQFSKIIKQKYDNQFRLDITSIIFTLIKDFFTYFYFCLLTLLGKISIGVLVQMLSVETTFQNNTQNIVNGIHNLIKKSIYLNDYIILFQYKTYDKNNGLSIKKDFQTIEFKNVSFSYPNSDVYVLKGINIRINKGEHLSIVGLNGQGKTTFIKLLCRLYEPTEGQILIDGTDINQYNYYDYIELISPVFQDFKLLSLSINENVKFDKSVDQSELDSIFSQLGIYEKICSFEKKGETIVYKSYDDNGIDLSGGEQQKLAIARAIIKNPQIYILDEPTSALDPIAEYDLYRKFKTLTSKKTTIYISHRLSSCRLSNRIAVFSDGIVKEYGTHEELMAIPDGIYSKMFLTQSKYYSYNK